MRLAVKLRAYARLRARRNRLDLVRHLVRRPAIALAISTYETAIVLSNRTEARYKQLAAIKASSLIGCPF